MHELTGDATEALSRDEIPESRNAQQHDDAKPMAAPGLRSLFECPGAAGRAASGIRSGPCRRSPSRLAGYRGVTAFAQFAGPALAGAARDGRGVPQPGQAALHRALDHHLPHHPRRPAAGDAGRRHRPPGRPLAMDGKDLPGASKQTGDGRRMMVAAVEHGTGMVLRQVEIGERSTEIPAVRDLSGILDVSGRVATMDAMHARHDPR